MASVNPFSMTRITGMTTGMDTDALVKSMTANKQSKYDALYRSKIQMQWKKDAYTEMNNTLRKLKDDFVSLTSQKSLMSLSAFSAFGVTMADNNNLQVKAGANAQAGNYSVEIFKIATAASLTGGQATRDGSGYAANVLSSAQLGGLTRLGQEGDAARLQNGVLTINGVDIEYSTTDTLKTLMDRVNKSAAGVTMTYSQLTDTFKIESKFTGEYDAALGATAAPTQPVKPTKPDDYDTNAAAKLSYDAALSQYNADLEVYNTYAANEKKNVSVSDSGGLLSLLNLNASTVAQGQNAEFSINGVRKTSQTNDISYDGVDFKLLEATNGSAISARVERDAKDSTEKIKTFVEELNKLLEQLYTMVTEKKNREYSPLTVEMKEEMTEKEIEDWEKEAKKGLMYRDNYIDSLYNAIRGAITGSGLSEAGITTGSYQVGKATQIQIDETKLAAALEDPSKLHELFSKVAGEDGKGGFITQVGAAIDQFTSSTKSNILQTLDNNLRDTDAKLKEQQDRIWDMADKYYIKFAKMESALASMNSQSSQLASYFPTNS
jgi:flagellar hook-associated protein 2